MYARFTKTVLICALSAVTLAACSNGIKSEDKKPAKLVQIDAPVSALSLVNQVSLEQGCLSKGERVSEKDVIDLQVAPLGDVLIAASRGGVVSALNDKQAIWSVDLKDAITSGVAADVSSNMAVVGTRSGKFIALDVKTGTKQWEVSLPASSQTPALIEGERVLVSAGNGVLYGLDVQTGDVVWQFGTQLTDVSVRGIARPLRLDEYSVLFGTADGRIHALDPKTGTPLWTRRVGLATGGSAVKRMSDIDGTPLVAGRYLYVSSFGGQFTGFDMATGRTMFVTDIVSTKSPALLNSTVIVSGVDGEIKAFDALTGEMAWSNQNLKYRKPTNPVVVGKYIAVGDYEGVIHLFDTDGKIVGRSQTKGQLTSLQVLGNLLYAQSASGVVSVWQF